ncbi:hypothetical protein J6590_007650 [Homalodisca vitripennis]|nr:hypothetical protein J6590_007650 [Homalodisca vitripennis]
MEIYGIAVIANIRTLNIMSQNCCYKLECKDPLIHSDWVGTNLTMTPLPPPVIAISILSRVIDPLSAYSWTVTHCRPTVGQLWVDGIRSMEIYGVAVIANIRTSSILSRVIDPLSAYR